MVKEMKFEGVVLIVATLLILATKIDRADGGEARLLPLFMPTGLLKEQSELETLLVKTFKV